MYDLEEECKKWVNGFNEFPLGMISELMDHDPDWEELTVPGVGDYVVIDETGIGGRISAITSEPIQTYRVDLDDKSQTVCAAQDFTVQYNGGDLPIWDALWQFSDPVDQEWLDGAPTGSHYKEMSDLDFRIFHSPEYGTFFGIDQDGYDFYSTHWMSLFKERGLAELYTDLNTQFNSKEYSLGTISAETVKDILGDELGDFDPEEIAQIVAEDFTYATSDILTNWVKDDFVGIKNGLNKVQAIGHPQQNRALSPTLSEQASKAHSAVQQQQSQSYDNFVHSNLEK